MRYLFTMKYFGPASLILLFLLSSLIQPTTIPAQSSQRSDEAQVESALQSRLQSMLDTFIGPMRSIVNVDVTLSDSFSRSDLQKVKALERLPGVQTKTGQTGAAGAQGSVFTSNISSIHITIDVDNSLSEKLIGTPEDPGGEVKKMVAGWAKINQARGDTIKVIPKDWPEVAPPSAAQQNYLLYSMLALLALLILIAAIYFPMRKIKSGQAGIGGAPVGGGEAGAPGSEAAAQERKRERREELEEMTQALAAAGGSGDNTETLNEIRELLEQALPKTSRDMAPILEEIKEVLGNPPQESDALLTEMRDTLSDLLDEQRKIAAKAGGMAAGPAAPGAAAGAAAAPGAAPAAGGETGGGTEMGAEIVEALGNLEELMAQQVEKTPEKEGMEEPFKYLKNTAADELILLIEDEEPKLAAAVLSQIEPKAAADVLENLEEEKRFEVARAMTGLTEEEDMAEEIKEFLERKLKIVRLHKDYVPVMGNRILADILSTSRYAVATVLLEKMEAKNPAMANEIRKRMFLFEDITELEDKDVEIVIHNLGRELLAHSLADVKDEVKDKFFRNMTEKAREMVREDMESVKQVQIEEEGRELPFNQALLNVDQTIIDEIFRTVDRTTLKMALRGASEAVQEKFFSGLTERAVAMLREDLEVMGGISRARADEAQDEIMGILRQLSSKALAAQHEVIATIRKLEHEGQITVTRFQEETL